MSEQVPGDITRLLRAAANGDEAARDEAVGLLYEELRRIARRKVRALAPGRSLQATDVLHETYLRIFDGAQDWHDRAHFLNAAALVMRHVLVDQQRARGRAKRGAGWIRASLEAEAVEADDEAPVVRLALDEALDDLALQHGARKRDVTVCRLFGMTVDEMADVLECSTSSVDRDWAFAKAWLQTRLGGPPVDEARS